jgi:hypothetical protein
LEDKFLSELYKKSTKRTKLSYEIYHKCYIDSSLSSNDYSKAKLLKLLEKIEKDKSIALPKSKDAKYWIKGKPELPQWIKILNIKKSKEEEVIYWHPKLSFMYNESNFLTRELAKQINNYLINRKKNPFSIAIKERSLQIFGDEKKLDSLRKGTIFQHITLEDIDCYLVPIPIISTKLNNNSNKIIIIENYNTYNSFCRYNQKTNYYCEVIYGWGVNANSDEMVQAIYERWERNNKLSVYYFGDIDPTGVNIAIGLGSRLNRVSTNITFKIDKRHYSYILTYGIRDTKNYKFKKNQNELYAGELFGELYNDMKILFEKRIRIAQEALNIEILMNKF